MQDWGHAIRIVCCLSEIHIHLKGPIAFIVCGGVGVGQVVGSVL